MPDPIVFDVHGFREWGPDEQPPPVPPPVCHHLTMIATSRSEARCADCPATFTVAVWLDDPTPRRSR